MRKLNSQFITRFISESGLDNQNGTYYGFIELDGYYCMAVAEGYDGEGGRESAKLAVDSAIEAFVQKPGMSPGKLRACLKKAHKSLVEQSVRIRLKAGILLIVSDYTRFRYAACGNVLLYALRENAIFHQSTTHTVYQAIKDEQKLAEDVKKPPEETKNLYHYLGGTPGISVSGKIKLKEGDVLLAVTESFWSKINRVEILDAFESIQSEDEFLGDLQELYLRGSTEGLPSFCLVAVSAKKVYKENTKLKKKILIWTLIIILILAVAGTIVYFVVKNRRQNQDDVRNTVTVYEDTGDRYLTELSCILAKQQYEKAIEAGKKLSGNNEKIQWEQILSEKINISTVLDEAAQAYGARNYVQARADYKKALELIALYQEMSSLTSVINQKQKLVSTGMEINNYMQNAAMKEAEGDLESAGILYDRAEAMLRIVDDPELLQQVQLAQIRIKGQVNEASNEERAKKRDEVIIDADKTAALDAILAGDFETAIEFYTKIRDNYIAMNDNEKAEEVTATILSLQKQQKAAKENEAAVIEADQTAAKEAAKAGDYEGAIALYEKIRDSYINLEETVKAEELSALILSLKKQAEESEQKTQPAEDEDKESVSLAGPGEISQSLEEELAPLVKDAKKAEAENNLAAAIAKYNEIRNIYIKFGNFSKVEETNQMIDYLTEMQEKEALKGPGGDING